MHVSAIPEDALKPLAHEFRHAVLAGLASGPRVPGPKNTKQKPGRELLEFCKNRQDDVLRFTTDTSIWPTNVPAAHEANRRAGTASCHVRRLSRPGACALCAGMHGILLHALATWRSPR